MALLESYLFILHVLFISCYIFSEDTLVIECYVGVFLLYFAV